MATELRWTSADLELMPEDGKRYEIVDGELYVSTQRHWHHQVVCSEITYCLQQWSRQTNAGTATQAPGLIFGESDDVAPDVVWISNERLETALAPDGKLHSAPELVVEVLSPGSTNERRDREVKLKLYSRRGVLEYWIVDWRQRQVEVYRRQEAVLSLVETLYEQDKLQSPLLPGFACDIRRLFPAIS
jgi:Uma2 family endonuclease